MVCQFLVAQQHLDDANVDLLLQQVGGEAVAQDVGRHVSVSSQFDGPMITIDDAEQPSLSVISEGVLADGYIAIKFGDVHQGHDQERRQR